MAAGLDMPSLACTVLLVVSQVVWSWRLAELATAAAGMYGVLR